MKEIKFNVYEFSELSTDAQKKAIENMRDKCYQDNSEWVWEDARETLDRLKEIANVHFGIEESSQGFYCRWCHEKDYFTDNRERFEQFKKEFDEQFSERVWCDVDLANIVRNCDYDEKRSYGYNIGYIAVAFCEEMNNEALNFYEDEEAIEEYIEEQDELFFHEDGTPYNE